MTSLARQTTKRLTLGALIAQSEQRVGGCAIRVHGAMRQGRATITIDVKTSRGTHAIHFDMLTQAITVERPMSVMRPAGRE
ncbi:MAG: hypothetical protein ACK40W_00410 [Allorhizobium sp.]|uniref:hypothetical protein n=1 Tax=Bosea sp. FBZP-16 TaxID=2065382 RepID=UPI000C31B1AE|nr:hypothetical protein [Bosea sp. FBZP-16]